MINADTPHYLPRHIPKSYHRKIVLNNAFKHHNFNYTLLCEDILPPMTTAMLNVILTVLRHHHHLNDVELWRELFCIWFVLDQRDQPPHARFLWSRLDSTDNLGHQTPSGKIKHNNELKYKDNSMVYNELNFCLTSDSLIK